MNSLNARSLAQEIASRYFDSFNPYDRHRINVEECLRAPVTAVTINLLTINNATATTPSEGAALATVTGQSETTPSEDSSSSALVNHAEEQEQNGGIAKEWKDPLATVERDLLEADLTKYDSLHRRSKARMEAFLEGVALAVASSSSSTTEKSPNSSNGISLADGLKGFSIKDSSSSSSSSDKQSQVMKSLNMSGQTLLRSISAGQTSQKKEKKEQVDESDLTTRLELYIRCLVRVKSQRQECVLAAEPSRALKARAQVVVAAFVGTVSTVRQQSPILTRLIINLTKELLAVEYLSPDLNRTIRRLVSDYEQQTSFASLAFLSTPDDSADQRLTPMILRYIKYLQSEWKNHESDCEMERMLTKALDPTMRKTFKTIEFRSIGHLLETCADFRPQLQKIELAPNKYGDPDFQKLEDNPDAVRQAIRDLQRERITVNGHLLPPVTSRKELVHLLQQTMNSRALTSSPFKSRRKKSRSRRKLGGGSSDKDHSEKSEASESDFTSATESDGVNHGTARGQQPHRRNFHVSTIDVLTKRLLVAASRTGTGGDAFFVVRDLFGGEEVEVIPSDMLPTHGRAVRPGSIEILVRLASVTIKCHASFDVYPKSMVRACEPLIQLHTTTTETISLQEVRACDSMEADHIPDSYDSEDTTKAPETAVMVLQERKTDKSGGEKSGEDKSGWRTLAIRPALYEKVEVWNTR